MRSAERIRFSRVYTCSWCICHGIPHKMIENSLNRHRSFLVPQNTDKFRHDESLFPVFVLIHHIQSLLDCQTWLAFFPYLIRFYEIIHLSFHSNLTQTDSAVVTDIIISWILTTTTACTGIIVHHLTYVEVTYNKLLRNLTVESALFRLVIWFCRS